MENNLKKKYGLSTAIAMVVGIVIGSGVFFKAEAVLKATGGSIPIGIIAWAVVGLIMIICSYSFSIMATRYEKVNGVVDYSEVMMGSKYGYYVGWFMATIYYPTITSVLAWVSARYTCVLLGWDITGGSCMTIACLYMIGSYAVNALSPVLAGRFQVSTTVIKLIPLLLMAIVGTIVGLTNGMTVANFTHVVDNSLSTGSGLYASIVAVAFAYEGWIIATSINAELKDSKKNLPKALVFGSIIVVAVYILYYIGLAGAVSTETLMESGEAGAKTAFQTIFGNVGGSLIFVFVIISCLGTLNGLMLGCTRGFYTLAVRGRGPSPKTFSQVDKATNMPTNSSVLGLFFVVLWLFYFYGAIILQIGGENPWFGKFCFDSSELPIVTLYALYIPMFIMMMKKEKDLNPIKRFVMPALSVLSCVFMVYAACIAHKTTVLYYLVIFLIIMLIGAFFSKKRAL